MAGEAKTSKFALGTATVMLGPCADMLDLGTDESLGLVKEVVTRTTPGFVTLTHGVTNEEVASKKNSNEVMIEGQMFEYTLKNLTYAASLDGSEIAAPTASTTTTAEVASGTAVIPLTSATGVAQGSYLALHVNSSDQIFVRKVNSLAGLNATIDSDLPVTLPSGARITVVGVVDVGSNKEQPYLSCKISGQLADDSWVHQYYPKVRVTSGLSLAFRTGDYDNIPLSIKPYALTADDPFYAWSKNPDGSQVRGRIYLA